jgi:hypothetical protein
MLSRGYTHFHLCSNHIGCTFSSGCNISACLFGYPVEEQEDIDNQILAQCNFSEEKSALLHGIGNILG